MNSHDILTAFRPSDAAVDDVWPADARAAVRDRVLSSTADAEEPTRRHWVLRHRRWVAIATVAACLAAAGAVVSTTLPGGAPGAPDAAAAAAIERLAVVAGEQGGTVRPGQFAYTSIVDSQPVQKGFPAQEGATVVDGTEYNARKQWVAPSGAMWIYRALGRPMPCLRDGYTEQSATELANYPTDTDALAAYFDGNPAGDNRGTRSRFMSVSDLVRSGLASPALRAASIRVLAQTDGIEAFTGVVDSRGRPAIRIDYTTRERKASRFLHRYHNVTQSLFFDPSTSRLLQEGGRVGTEVSVSSVTEESAIVDAIPSGLTACPPRTVPAG